MFKILSKAQVQLLKFFYLFSELKSQMAMKNEKTSNINKNDDVLKNLAQK
jgi:hypothetical protein